MSDTFDVIKAVAAATLTNEASVDQALCEVAQLIITSAQARHKLNAPAAFVQPALDQLEKALAAQLESRRAIGNYHRSVGKIARIMGEGPDQYGPLWPCPQLPKGASDKPNGPSLPELARAHLRSVA